MSNTSVKVAFAFFVILAYPAASLARHAITTAIKNTDSGSSSNGEKNMDSSNGGKCVLASPAATPSTAVDSTPRSVCWAPDDIIEAPGV
jgi:hypothetical protein